MRLFPFAGKRASPSCTFYHFQRRKCNPIDFFNDVSFAYWQTKGFQVPFSRFRIFTAFAVEVFSLVLIYFLKEKFFKKKTEFGGQQAHQHATTIERNLFRCVHFFGIYFCINARRHLKVEGKKCFWSNWEGFPMTIWMKINNHNHQQRNYSTRSTSRVRSSAFNW